MGHLDISLCKPSLYLGLVLNFVSVNSFGLRTRSCYNNIPMTDIILEILHCDKTLKCLWLILWFYPLT